MERGWHTYVNSIELLDRSADRNAIDVIFIDGRARVGCAIRALEYVHEKTRVFIHDWPRSYNTSLLFYDLVATTQELAELSPKAEYVGERIDMRWIHSSILADQNEWQ
ncbi:hypothetical protein KDA14_04960 [Candidatus Saccharibacteria bacterium]|nr:hypothetical protein [Candidatus Saccharibacteria bacterium]